MAANAAHMTAVPGRKADVSDAERIADLAQHGLLRASHIPDKGQRELRELSRHRKSPAEDRTRELNRPQKTLEGANIKLSGAVEDTNGTGARNMLNHIATGRNPMGRPLTRCVSKVRLPIVSRRRKRERLTASTAFRLRFNAEWRRNRPPIWTNPTNISGTSMTKSAIL